MSKNYSKNNSKSKQFIIPVVVIAMFLVVIIGVVLMNKGKETNKDSGNEVISQSNANKKEELTKDSDLVIPINNISATASFYPVEIEGTQLEVLAVKAPDGTIRTAFNTCQICYSSGRGYYEQTGDVLICQNCGNEFKTSDVEITKGGCNPVPIFAEDKEVDDENIIISKEYLTKSKEIFANWKI